MRHIVKLVDDNGGEPETFSQVVAFATRDEAEKFVIERAFDVIRDIGVTRAEAKEWWGRDQLVIVYDALWECHPDAMRTGYPRATFHIDDGSALGVLQRDVPVDPSTSVFNYVPVTDPQVEGQRYIDIPIGVFNGE